MSFSLTKWAYLNELLDAAKVCNVLGNLASMQTDLFEQVGYQDLVI